MNNSGAHKNALFRGHQFRYVIYFVSVFGVNKQSYIYTPIGCNRKMSLLQFVSILEFVSYSHLFQQCYRMQTQTLIVNEIEKITSL